MANTFFSNSNTETNSKFVRLKDPDLDCPGLRCPGFLAFYGKDLEGPPVYVVCSEKERGCSEKCMISSFTSTCKVCYKKIPNVSSLSLLLVYCQISNDIISLMSDSSG